MSSISHFIVENTPQRPDYVFTQAGAGFPSIVIAPMLTTLCRRKNGHLDLERKVFQPVRLDERSLMVLLHPPKSVVLLTELLAILPSMGTDGIKPFSHMTTHWDDTSLPPAAIEVSLEMPGT